MEDLLLDSTEAKNGILEIANSNEDKEILDTSENQKTVNLGTLFNNPALKVYTDEEIEQAKAEEVEKRAERDANYLKMIYDSNLNEYREKYGYEMDGKSKRRLRKDIIRKYQKGKIKVKDFNEFN